jgi:hypothetical protein
MVICSQVRSLSLIRFQDTVEEEKDWRASVLLTFLMPKTSSAVDRSEAAASLRPSEVK